jgi:serine/threonine protein kinase
MMINDYHVIEEIDTNQVIVSTSINNNESTKLFLIRKYKLYEENRYEWSQRVNALQFLKEKNLIHLHDSFLFRNTELDQYYCTVEQLTGYTTLRRFMWNMSQIHKNQKFVPVENQMVQNVMKGIIESLSVLHAVGVPYGHLSPLNIVIEEETNRVLLRPLDIVTDTSVWYVTKQIDPYTFRLNNQSKSTIMEFEERQVWYFPPEVVFKLKETKYYHSIYSDCWALGCVFAECFLPYPVFSAEDLPNQIIQTFTILGLPDRMYVPEVILQTGIYETLSEKLPVVSTDDVVTKLRNLRKNLSAENLKLSFPVVQILSLLLDYNMKKRPEVGRLGGASIFANANTAMYKWNTSRSRSKLTSALALPVATHTSSLDTSSISTSSLLR